MEFLKIFHIDCGRKYFTKDELIHLIGTMGSNGYNMLELAIGNGGLRFLLDDMTVETAEKVYSSDDVKKAVNAGNRAFCDNGTNELFEEEMLELIKAAKSNNILIMPLLNSPGHMDAIVTAMEQLGIADVRYNGSKTTLNFACKEGDAFLKAFIGKYISWFAKQGSTMFNMGCDEYANDVLESGFASLCNEENFEYDKFVSYVNELADMILVAGMTPVMFNDGMYYSENLKGGMLKKDIVCSYWSEGWPGYTPAKARFVEAQGHKILNTANDWYYVLGRRNSQTPRPMFTDEDAKAGIDRVCKLDTLGGIEDKPMGAMMCLWCDEPWVNYTAEEENIVDNLLKQF